MVKQVDAQYHDCRMRHIPGRGSDVTWQHQTAVVYGCWLSPAGGPTPAAPASAGQPGWHCWVLGTPSAGESSRPPTPDNKHAHSFIHRDHIIIFIINHSHRHLW